MTGSSQVFTPSDANKVDKASIDLSVEGFWDAVSETIRIAGLSFESGILQLYWETWEDGGMGDVGMT